MRALKIMLTIMLVGVIVLLAGCASSSSGSAVQNQETTVKRGDMKIEITATGNLAFSEKEGLAFEMAGTVAEVLVEAGDSVTEGQELVRLDVSEWQKRLDTLKTQVAIAERQVSTKERDLVKADRQVTAKELAVHQAELDLQSTEKSVSQIAEVKAAQDAVDNAEYELKTAQSMLQASMMGALSGITNVQLNDQITFLSQKLAELKKDLQEILSGTSIKVSGDVALQVAKINLQVVQSNRALEDARIAVDDAVTAVTDARIALDEAREALKNAQEEWDEAQSYQTVIASPFAGIVTKVNVSGGGEVKKGTVVLEIANPTRFEAEVMVSEMDIFQVREGGQATVQLTADSTVSLPARVTRISPTATVQSGVVNYKVKIEVQSRTALSQNITTPRLDASAGQLSDQLRAAIAEGRMTQEQLNETMERRQQQGFAGFGQTAPSGASSNVSPEQFAGRQFVTGQQQTSTAVSTAQLREGLTVAVNIVVTQKTNVLMVPNRAISRQGGQTVVKVIKDGQIESRMVTIGINDFQNTEIVQGLSEGEKVVISQTATTSNSGTQTQGQQPGGVRVFPGGGGGIIR
ncbi:MAG: HlyD family efflux transporter periplasmic adaptor subunit [Chloroflexi bacterium]|nr:HlyD family efflux transporter periplasmic adaptor subunit [Chloroflexota bacterium]